MTSEIDESHRQQAAIVLRRWLRRAPRELPAEPAVPRNAPLPPAAEAHYRAFAWVVHEQRLAGMLLAALLAACGLVWLASFPVGRKPAVVVRAGPSLKEAAAAFYRTPELSYDQLAFFINGCVPLLYASQSGHFPLLPLAEGLAAPEICREAERRLTAHSAAMAAQAMNQDLTLTEIADVVSDPAEGRAAARLAGYLTVTTRDGAARFFPWRGRAVVAVNPGSRLDPYPFYLLTLEAESSPP